MKRNILTLLFCWLTISFAGAQTDGKILEKTKYILPDSVITQLEKLKELDSPEAKELATNILNTDFFRITYRSDGLKVVSYVAEPKGNGKYPCIIFNRGGNRDFGKLTLNRIVYNLGLMSSWGYVVIGSQYRGVDGGEGGEEFGGEDVNDVLNLIPVLEQLPKADTSRIGIEGWSRGGMMTYQVLKNTCRFKAAVVGAGLANSFENIARRPGMEENVYSELVPDYWNNKEEELKKRSAVFWADEMCKTTPLLILHGSSDWRVLPEESLELVNKLYEYKHPTRFILYEGADHGISEFRSEYNDQIKQFFNDYVRDLRELPNMEPHGR
ncbi:prolyl oligopeptidase family serine peptidase [uncultured Draconibacterium sp.]|uniref:alpha/beta hydrolase family protein n=1 Tax=uncultured Draconibacterium sp. TaxID=1573823 RepID=UPI0029C7C893|nr:prolyl oligopeptidase family serine peptidase [uncultured Draconibacterium sp.]